MSEVLAGKIGVTNGGEWNAETYYEEATFVRHQNNLYLSNLPSTGVEPTNEEYWMLAMEGFSGEDVQTLIDSINNIIDGTSQVGNAKTLDGHEAEYFLPKSGGTINGDITVEKESGQVTFSFKNGNREMAIVVTESGTCGVLDQTNKVWLWNSELNGTTKFYGTASGNLPLDGGGTVSSNNDTPITIKSKTSKNVYQRFVNSEGVGWYFGFDEKGARVVGHGYLLHTGNKPTGSYTGNGSTVKRTIATGGIGDAIVVKGSNGTCAFIYKGAIGREGTTVKSLTASEVDVSESILYLITNDACLNAEGVVYTYHVV